MSTLPLSTLVACLLPASTWMTWLFLRRLPLLQRRLAAQEAEIHTLRQRLDEVVCLYEGRLKRLEGVQGGPGSRASERRRAADLIRCGADIVTAAQRCRLPAAEVRMLAELAELRTRAVRPAAT